MISGLRRLGLAILLVAMSATAIAQDFEGQYFRGSGDVEYLKLLDVARRMFEPDPEFQNISMLYTPAWNGFVEGPTWGAWWIQNSYGPTYCALPIYAEPYVTFLQNAQDLWFNQMGDGKRVSYKDWCAPDGCLCDAAYPGAIIYKQGDGRTDIHDWAMEFTAAGLLMQSELLLISRDSAAIAHYVPMLERCAAFIETRRDPAKDLFLAGPAGNLLAPSYAGWQKPDGTFDKAYLTGLSVTYIAALDRLIEVEKLAGNADKAATYAGLRDRARNGLKNVTTDEGYLIKSLDPDGTRHGVYGAEKYGYFESSPNHDAIAFRVVDDAQAKKILDKIVSIPNLRRHHVIIPNEPGLDDMYDPGTSWLWKHGTWVNGGHWSTCEARMVMAYYRLGQYDDARKSMEHMLGFARQFRMDNPLVDFGNNVYQPKEPVNLCYDSFGPVAGLIRGLFEYLYRADGLTLIPHIPPTITRLEQHFPVRFGTKSLYLASYGSGPVTAVRVNGKAWESFDAQSIRLPYESTPDMAYIQVALGGADLDKAPPFHVESSVIPVPAQGDAFWDVSPLRAAIQSNVLPLRIGADSQGGNRFAGEIGRVQIFAAALDDAQVAALAQRKEAVLPQPVFDTERDGVYANPSGASPAAKVIDAVEVADAPKGKALQLKGGFLEVADDAKLEPKDAFTLTAWIKPGDLPEQGARIIDKIPVGSADGYLLDLSPKNTLRFITRYGTVSQPISFDAKEWRHVAATYDRKAGLRLYANGVRIAEKALEPTPKDESLDVFGRFYARLAGNALSDCYEARHAALIIDALSAAQRRREQLAGGTLKPLPAPAETAADRTYLGTVLKLADGLRTTLESYAAAEDAHQEKVYAIWQEVQKG